MVAPMPWMRHKLRDQDVWAKVDARGALATDSAGRVEVVYKAAAGAKVYRASSRNLAPLGGDPIEIETDAPLIEAAAAAAASAAPQAKGIPADAIHVWTDGACTGNPGPASVGVVVIDGAARRELGEYLGLGTNNIAELTAIGRGLALVADPTRPVVVYSDSSYAIGLLSKGWKAKANVELVAALRKQLTGFADVRFVKVKGHAGIIENERCDQLAREAILAQR
jgi:ribonuclease HI